MKTGSWLAPLNGGHVTGLKRRQSGSVGPLKGRFVAWRRVGRGCQRALATGQWVGEPGRITARPRVKTGLRWTCSLFYTIRGELNFVAWAWRPRPQFCGVAASQKGWAVGWARRWPMFSGSDCGRRRLQPQVHCPFCEHGFRGSPWWLPLVLSPCFSGEIVHFKMPQVPIIYTLGKKPRFKKQLLIGK